MPDVALSPRPYVRMEQNVSLIDNTLWWQVFPLGACGAPIRIRSGDDSAHRLPRLIPWLDHVVDLGCNGLLLGPIFESVSHGYDTLDHFQIDRRLGDQNDFDDLISQCTERGIAVMLDGVFNHVAVTHPRAAQLAASSPDGTPQVWEGHNELVVLDHSKSEVIELVAEAMLYWLRRGIAGWRLDVAYAVPSSFWREVTGIVRAEFPEAVFLGEVIHGDYPQFVAESSLDTVTQYELWKATWSSIQTRNFWELAWSLERHEAFVASFVPQTFIGNHDVERIASQVGDSGAVLAVSALLTLPGMPSIYYGDEQAFRGRKLEGFAADDELRPPLPDSPDALSDMGMWMENIYKGLIALRKQRPWLARARIKVDGKQNEWIEYTVTPRDSETADHDGLHVRLDVDPLAHVAISDLAGHQLFAWGEQK